MKFEYARMPQEPLCSMIDSKNYKTMDVVGYLKSVLENARPYARMKVFCFTINSDYLDKRFSYAAYASRRPRYRQNVLTRTVKARWYWFF